MQLRKVKTSICPFTNGQICKRTNKVLFLLMIYSFMTLSLFEKLCVNFCVVCVFLNIPFVMHFLLLRLCYNLTFQVVTRRCNSSKIKYFHTDTTFSLLC